MGLLERLAERYTAVTLQARTMAERILDSKLLPVKTQGAIELAAMPLIDANEHLATSLHERFHESSEI